MSHTDLQRVVTHVLARRRHDACGRFGLRAAPGGIATPSYGAPDAPEVLRTSGSLLVHETGGDVRALELDGTSLAAAAAWAGVDLTAELSVGHDTPALGDPEAPLRIDGREAAALGDWFCLGWQILDAVAAQWAEPTAIQLWPEHFDAGCAVTAGTRRANLGAAAPDATSPVPYLYVGPWDADRPGDPAYWNAPFGAVLAGPDLDVAEAAAWLTRGLTLLAG